MKLCNKGVDNLRYEIVRQATEDYMDIRKKQHLVERLTIEPDRFLAKLDRELAEVMGFFRSKWYCQLCDIDFNDLIKMLDTKIEEWKNNLDEVDEFVRLHREKYTLA